MTTTNSLQETIATSNQLPQTGFLRVWQVVGCKKRNIAPLIPIGRTTFLNNVKSKKYPYLIPVKLGERTTAYKVEDIRRLITDLGALQ